MAKKVRRRAKSKTKLRKRKLSVPHNRTNERVFLLAAIFLAIISIIILFNPAATTFVTLDNSLTKTSYNIGDSLDGEITLGMQPNDILHKNTMIDMFVFNKEDKPECQERYICYNGDTIEWQEYDSSKDKCVDIEYASGNTGDPAAECCYRNQANCLGIKEALNNIGFEQGISSSPEDWSTSPYGRAAREHKTSTPTHPTGVDYSGKTDSKGVLTTYKTNIKLSQEFPRIPVKYFGDYQQAAARQPMLSGYVIETFENPLEFLARWEDPSRTREHEPYAFEIVLTSDVPSNSKLHYWFNVGKMPPSDTIKNKYIVVSTESEFPEKNWKEFTLNVYNDWRNKGFPATDNLRKIELISIGKKVLSPTQVRGEYSTTYYGQKVNWDNIKLTYNLEESTQCTDFGKKCCAERRGIGNYYGEQLECSSGECWDDCTEFFSFTLEEFIEQSTTPTKMNETIGPYKSGGRILGDTGPGYGYCFETTDEDDEECYGWDNEYAIELGNDSTEDEFEFAVPGYGGSYELIVNVSYVNFQGDLKELDSATENFVVGEGTVGPDCPDDDYSFVAGNWSNWSNCINGTMTRTRILYGTYTGSDSSCPTTKDKIDTEYESCGCIPDWNCEWQFCTMGEQQDKICHDLNDCEEDYIDVTRICCIEDWECSSWSSCEYGEQTRSCYDNNGCGTEFNEPETTRICEKPFFVALWWLWVLIALVVVIVVLFAAKIIPLPLGKRKRKIGGVIKSKTKTPAGEYSELTNYINQAIGYGATRQEIRTKLHDAGWPSNAIEKAFKTAKK